MAEGSKPAKGKKPRAEKSGKSEKSEKSKRAKAIGERSTKGGTKGRKSNASTSLRHRRRPRIDWKQFADSPYKETARFDEPWAVVSRADTMKSMSQRSVRPGGGTLPTSYWGTLSRSQRIPGARLDAIEASQNSLRESNWIGRHYITYSKDNKCFSATQREYFGNPKKPPDSFEIGRKPTSTTMTDRTVAFPEIPSASGGRSTMYAAIEDYAKWKNWKEERRVLIFVNSPSKSYVL